MTVHLYWHRSAVADPGGNPAYFVPRQLERLPPVAFADEEGGEVVEDNDRRRARNLLAPNSQLAIRDEDDDASYWVVQLQHRRQLGSLALNLGVDAARLSAAMEDDVALERCGSRPVFDLEDEDSEWQDSDEVDVFAG